MNVLVKKSKNKRIHFYTLLLLTSKASNVTSEKDEELSRNDGKRKCPYRVGMQHSKEVGAGEELGAGGLEQQGQARP